MDNNTLLKGTSVQLLPFETKHWSDIARWFYDKDYKEFFRQFTKVLTEEDFQNYPKAVGGTIFMVHSLLDNNIIGLVQVIPCFKKNKGAYIGVIIDKASQKKHLPSEVMLILLDHLFNRDGYNKVVIEILESNEGLKRVLEKTGFYKEGKLLQECFMDGRFRNELRYSMSNYYFNKFKSKLEQEYKQWAHSLKK